MKDSRPSDEKPARKTRTGGAPIGTQSLTGDPAKAGMPLPVPEANDEDEDEPDLPPGADEPDPPQPRG